MEPMVNGEERAKIGIVKFDNPQLLEKQAAHYIKAMKPLSQWRLRKSQGMLEGSNVKPVLEMTTMMKTVRSVSATTQNIDNSYELQRKAISTLSKQQEIIRR